MSKSTVAAIVVAACAAGLLIGVYLVPRLFVAQAREQAVKSAQESALQKSAREVGEAAVREKAKEIADSILAGAGKPGVPRPSAAVEPPVHVAVEAPVRVERQAFSLTLPAGSSVDPADAEAGSERLVEVNVPGHGSVNIVVIDDKNRAADIERNTVQRIRDRLENPVDVMGDVEGWTRFTGVYGISGKAGGVQEVIEIGRDEGREKACLVIVQYPGEPAADRKQVAARIHQALGSFQIKE